MPLYWEISQNLYSILIALLSFEEYDISVPYIIDMIPLSDKVLGKILYG